MLATAQLTASADVPETTAAEQYAATPYGQWRGLMIDVSRHFMPMDFLRRQVEAMSHFGLRTLHLHLTDAAGWRIEVKGYPRLTTLAAWRTAPLWKDWWNDGQRHYAEQPSVTGTAALVGCTPNGTLSGAFGGFYTQEEMRSLVRFADSLGVSIMPEIEFPAHSEEVTAAYPSLGCTGQPYQCADFCLGNEETYRFIDSVVEQMADIFTSPYLHLGGDEAAGSHWLECPRCTSRMKALGISTRQQLQHYAMQRVAGIVARHGRRMVAWDEALPPAADDTASLKPVIMVWRDINTAERAIRQGHDVVLCPGRWCYLDAYQDAPLGEPEAMGGYTPFDSVWHFVREQSASRHGLLGLQLNLWTEYVPQPQHAERMLWPRALALSPSCQASPSLEEARRYVTAEALPWLRQHGIAPFPLEDEVGQRPAYGEPIACLSTHCPVSYLAPYHEAYPAAGASALTDGLRGGWNNCDGRWQGFISRQRLDVVIDLGQPRSIHTVEADFLQSLGPEIYLPETIEILTSNDGLSYTLLYNTRARRNPQPMAYQTMGWHASPTTARYVRFRAMAGERGGWIFTDEIIVR